MLPKTHLLEKPFWSKWRSKMWSSCATGCSLNIVFYLKFFEFSELCQFCCSAGVLPAWRVYTHWHRDKTESGKYIKIFEKTQYLMNTLYVTEKTSLYFIDIALNAWKTKKWLKLLKSRVCRPNERLFSETSRIHLFFGIDK